MRRASVLALALLAASAPARAQAVPFERIQTLTPGYPVAATRLVDLDGSAEAAGPPELVVVGRRGDVRVWRWDAAAGALAPAGERPLTLPDPSRTLLALADLDGRGAPQLVTLSPDGALAYAPLPGAGFASEGVRLAARARFRLRPGQPTFAEFVRDVNGDGRLDVLVPARESCELWLNEPAAAPEGAGDAGAGAALRRAATVDVPAVRFHLAGTEALSDVLVSSFSLPGLTTRDVNGDGREDLLVSRERTRAFHLQRADGGYPREPDVSVDLGIFRDTSPDPELEPGEILGGGQEAQFLSRDLDDDGIADHVIAHRRKVWVFPGGPDGPQFTEPSAILKVADEVTALLVLDLDDDSRPDLLLIKVEVPGVSALVFGLLREWDVTIRAVGYRNASGRTFELTPAWRRELSLRLPPILDLVQDPAAVLDRFEAVERRFRVPTLGDLDADGGRDLLLVSEDGARLDLWRGRPEDGERAWEPDPHGLRHVLFEHEREVWDLDRILEAFGNLAEDRFETLTEGRPADASLPLRDPERFALVGVEAGDLDGDGRDEVLVHSVAVEGERAGERSIDVLRLR